MKTDYSELQTPGPGTYNTTEPSLYKDKAPHYSMTSRNVMPGDTTQKPGPGAHSPENVSTIYIYIWNLQNSKYWYIFLSISQKFGIRQLFFAFVWYFRLSFILVLLL